jgi:hypothetical protein
LPTDDYPGGAATWGDFLDRQLDRSLKQAGADLAWDVEAFEEKAQELRQLLHRYAEGAPKRLVHGDYFLDNVLFDSSFQVSAVLDFGAHTLAGDPRLDATSAIIFLGLEPAVKPWNFAYVTALAQEQYGDGMLPLIDMYPKIGQSAPACRQGDEWPSSIAVLEHLCHVGCVRTGDEPVFGGLRPSAPCTTECSWRSAR